MSLEKVHYNIEQERAMAAALGAEKWEKKSPYIQDNPKRESAKKRRQAAIDKNHRYFLLKLKAYSRTTRNRFEEYEFELNDENNDANFDSESSIVKALKCTLSALALLEEAINERNLTHPAPQP